MRVVTALPQGGRALPGGAASPRRPTVLPNVICSLRRRSSFIPRRHRRIVGTGTQDRTKQMQRTLHPGSRRGLSDLRFDHRDEALHGLLAQIDRLGTAAGDDRHVGDANDAQDEPKVLGREVAVADR